MRRFAVRFATAALSILAVVSNTAHPDPYPPYWGSAAVHFPPVLWPSEPADPKQCGASCGEWLPYTRFQNNIADPRTQDPSNGGTAPQNYVNIASSCVDKSFPSIYYSLRQGAAPDGGQDTIMFRWRVEQIANTYATGPSAGTYGATDPWNSALWSVLFDVDGDGYVDLAAHLDGSSGSPSAAIDRIAGIWSKLPTQSLDYLGDPTNVKLIAHNPTAFIDSGSSRIFNFQGTNTPIASWPNGAAGRDDQSLQRVLHRLPDPCGDARRIEPRRAEDHAQHADLDDLLHGQQPEQSVPEGLRDQQGVDRRRRAAGAVRRLHLVRSERSVLAADRLRGHRNRAEHLSG
jgi:hypothetical protein